MPAEDAPAPLLVRVHGAAVWILQVVTHLHYLFWDELLWAWTPPAQRESVNRSSYGELSTYLPGGNVFEAGLFAWEMHAISQPPFPRAGRILVGGAGGGRELHALCGMGFDVVAFEPTRPLFEGARQVAAPYSGSTAVCASYRDLVAAVEDRSGPLADHVLNTPFDAVIFGWGSFSYIQTASDRSAALRAVRRLAPHAPLLLSFFNPAHPEDGRLDRLRPMLRRLFRLLGAPSDFHRGDGFDAAFYHGFAREEIQALAHGAGYRTLYCRMRPEDPHAMLLPQ